MENTYRVLNAKDGYKVISFCGHIGTYWREGRIEFNPIGMTQNQIDAKVKMIVEENRGDYK